MFGSEDIEWIAGIPKVSDHLELVAASFLDRLEIL
jgi:hypothetical protein